MAKFRVISDLHLEGRDITTSAKDLIVTPEDSETNLVLAGDISNGSLFISSGWLYRHCIRFKNVVIVFGNHDFWHGYPIRKSAAIIKEMIEDLGITNAFLLDCDYVEIDGVLVVGATLWTDLKKGDPMIEFNLPRYMVGDVSCKVDSHTWLNAHEWSRLHRAHKSYITQVLSSNPSAPALVVTHHSPLLNMAPVYFRGRESNYFFESDLSEMILDYPQIKAWVFGHVHNQTETYIGDTRVLCNCCPNKEKVVILEIEGTRKENENQQGINIT